MQHLSDHTFHIPVMGLGYTIDTPVKVARFGISSVVSIIQDTLVEHMREFYCKQSGEEYVHIPVEDIDHRAKRICAYLDLMQRIISGQLEKMKQEPFEEGSDIVKYFRLLPEGSPVKKLYLEMTCAEEPAKEQLQAALRERIIPGAIDVNIMTKVDNLNYAKDGSVLPVDYSDAVSVLRGFADSGVNSSVVFSAGLNPRLFGYLEGLAGFYPDEQGNISKKIILKVSDYRSALIQGKVLAKKGLWVSEFRIESGLNCGGHAFPTEGYLLGPILEEFKEKRQELTAELLDICNKALQGKNRPTLPAVSKLRITVQGGIGTAGEDRFLREYYNIDSTGWGSPFLMVPEATNIDEDTLQKLVTARQEDYYLSYASPLGIPFNNFRHSSSEKQRKQRMEKNRPGSPCYKKHLAFSTEFTEKPICLSSREYQNKKLKALQADTTLSEEERTRQCNEVMEKDCLCEGLASSALLVNDIRDPHHLEAVTICPGPNLAYFSAVFSLEEMVGHIYGRANILNQLHRPHMFINELKMYVDYLKKETEKSTGTLNERQAKYLASFKANLLEGIAYYKALLPRITGGDNEQEQGMKEEIEALEAELHLDKKELDVSCEA